MDEEEEEVQVAYKGSLILACNHAFHAQCLNKWLEMHPVKCCPLCRMEFNA